MPNDDQVPEPKLSGGISEFPDVHELVEAGGGPPTVTAETLQALIMGRIELMLGYFLSDEQIKSVVMGLVRDQISALMDGEVTIDLKDAKSQEEIIAESIKTIAATFRDRIATRFARVIGQMAVATRAANMLDGDPPRMSLVANVQNQDVNLPMDPSETSVSELLELQAFANINHWAADQVAIARELLERALSPLDKVTGMTDMAFALEKTGNSQ